MRLKILLALLISLLALVCVGTVSLAQRKVPPPPYAGLNNPFPWNDSEAQAAGSKVYLQSCTGCHGVTGSGIASADFSSKNFPGQLESTPDYYYWIISEGNMDTGMPSFKASLSEEQRWQVLTYLWSLSSVSVIGPEIPPPKAGVFRLNSINSVNKGQPLLISAVVLDEASKPITGFSVYFFVREEFFVSDLMAIGDNITDVDGVASFEYIPRQAGKTDIFARYGNTQVMATTFVNDDNTSFYQAEAGIRLPALGPAVFIGPNSATEPTVGHAPTSALRLPGGLLSWLWLLVLPILLIYFTYFRVLYQLLRISNHGGVTGQSLNYLPRIGLIIIVVFCILVILMIITGPYTHFNLLPY